MKRNHHYVEVVILDYSRDHDDGCRGDHACTLTWNSMHVLPVA